MSWHYSRALVAEYSAESCSGGEPSAPLNGTPTPAAYYWPDKTTGHSRLSRFGMTSKPLTADRGEALLMLFLAASRARTSAQPEVAQDLTESEADSGAKWQGSFTKYDPATRSWKTRQFSLLGGLVEFSETWPRWGSMRNGECLERPIAERPTCESESGLWPTPTCGGGGQTLPEGTTPTGKTPEGRKQTVCLERYVQQVERKVWPTPTVAMAKGSSGGGFDAQDRQEPGERQTGLRGGGRRQEWPPEPDVGRVAHGLASRVDRITALGNGQVPRVVAAAWRHLAPNASI